MQPILKEVTKKPIRVSKHRLVNNDPEPDKTTQYNYITDMHVFKTDGATLRFKSESRAFIVDYETIFGFVLKSHLYSRTHQRSYMLLFRGRERFVFW